MALFCMASTLACGPKAVTSQGSTSASPTRTALSSGTALYPRAIRLSHNSDGSKNGSVVVSVTAFPNGNAEADLYASKDGASFSKLSSITDPDFLGGLCCGALYELPVQVGALSPGTLLWAGSVGQTSATAPMVLKIYKSADQGATWSYLSNCAAASSPRSVAGGLWEPSLTIAGDGALVCFYSDETQPNHNQLLNHARSYDGVHWQAPTYVIASNIPQDRPGMAVVTKLPSGTYFMTHELCGPAACTVFYKTSSDGWVWGDAANVGARIQTAAGEWFEHAPVNAWSPSVSSTNGTIFVVGQMMYDNNGVSPGNGVTLFTNHSPDGSGAWTAVPAPVNVPDAYDNYCPNYSSALLPSVDGKSLLELASDYAGSLCQTYFATGQLN
jgi:hypothetical protein